MQDQINQLSTKVLTPRRDQIARLDARKIIEGQPNDLSDMGDVIRDLVSWAKWISRLDPAKYFQYFSYEDLVVINANLPDAIDKLIAIQSDRETTNVAGRIYVDPGLLRTELLHSHGLLFSIGRARVEGRASLREAREAADEAVAARYETEKLAQQKAVGTLAEYFQELVVEGEGTGGEISSWWKNQGYEYKARRWLWITGLAAILAVAYSLAVVLWVHQIGQNDSSSQIYAKLVTKILAVFPAIYLVRIFQRNYNAFMHLATINRHKAQALKTLKAYLSDPAITPEARVEILKEANHYVFDTGETGFITTKEGAGSSGPELKIGPLSLS